MFAAKMMMVFFAIAALEAATDHAEMKRRVCRGAGLAKHAQGWSRCLSNVKEFEEGVYCLVVINVDSLV